MINKKNSALAEFFLFIAIKINYLVFDGLRGMHTCRAEWIQMQNGQTEPKGLPEGVRVYAER